MIENPASLSTLTGRYHIDRELAAGGMATVYLAEYSFPPRIRRSATKAGWPTRRSRISESCRAGVDRMKKAVDEANR